ncbi:MAG TPA: 6-carboxytetrahydropterin synthase, partial [Dehalococcoidia bacterium]|nr:6-carboxytetrahydropterin synthase [Dehalococcoidia bacterium]
LTEDAWVFDFGELKSIAKELCDELDHKFILQMQSRLLAITEGVHEYEVRFGEGPRYVFPKSDVFPLPKDNSTAERIAEWFVERLAAILADADNVTTIAVGVEEAPGQSGWCRLDVAKGDRRGA